MGANSQEYNKTLAERLEEDHEKSYLGKKYDKLAQRTGPIGIIGGSMAPAFGSMLGSTLQKNGDIDWGEYATMGGSAIGAAMAPIMYRSMQKQSIKDIQDTSTRNTTLRKGGKISGVQAIDSMLNAGKSSKSAIMGGLAGSYGYGAITGNLMDPATMMLASKASNALSNPGSMAYLAASQMAGANYFGGSGNTHQAALLGSGISSIGNIANDYGFTGLGESLNGIGSGIYDMTGMGGSLTGMLTYILASAGGNKLMKSIKASAQAKDTKKYNYKVGDLGRPASTDRDVTKYDTMKSVAAQINLLTITGQLSPFESLALGYYQSMDKHLLFLNAIYDILNDEEKDSYLNKDNTFVTHNEIEKLINSFKDGDFDILNNYSNPNSKNYLERSGDRITDIYHRANKWIQETSTDTQAFFDTFNPIKVLTGGLLGNSSTKDIKALYGLNEETLKENAISQTATDLRVPTNLIMLAEMDIAQVMKLSDTIEGKQLAVQSFSASILQHILKLKLDDRHTEDGNGYFNRTQRYYDLENDQSWLTKIYDKTEDIVGNIPLLNVLSSISAGIRGINKRKKANEHVNDPSIIDSLALSESADIENNDFLSFQFPNLFLENLSLDEERNQLLKELLKCWGCDISEISKKSYGVYDVLSKQIGTETNLQHSFKTKFEQDSESIAEQYKKAIENDPKNTEHYENEKNKELKALQENLLNLYKQSNIIKTVKFENETNSVASQQEEEENKKYKSEMLKAFKAIAKQSKEKHVPKSNLIDDVTPKSLKKHWTNGWAKGGLLGALGNLFILQPAIKTTKLLTTIFGSILNYGIRHKRTGGALMLAAGLGYLAYQNKDIIKEAAKKVSSSVSGIMEYFRGDGLDGNWEDLDPAKKTGMVMSSIGGLLISVPNPYAKAAGALMLLAGTGLQLNWKKVIKDIFIKHPDFARFMEFLIPDDMKKSIGLDNIKELQYQHRVLEQKKHDAKMWVYGHKDFKNHSVKELTDGLKVLDDEKESAKLAKLIKAMDTNNDGNIDDEDVKKDEKKFKEAQLAFSKEQKEYSKRLTELHKASIELAHGQKEELLKISKHTAEQMKILGIIALQAESTKYKLSAIQDKHSADYNQSIR